MIAIYAILVALLLWAFLGKVPTYVAGQGVLIVKAGSIYSATAPEGSGRVANILVMPGDQVKKGQKVVELEQEDLEKQILVRQDYFEQLLVKLDRLSATAEEKLSDRGKQVAEQNAILARMIQTEEKNLSNLRELVRIKKASFEKGIETKEQLFEAMSDLYRSQSAIEQYKDRIAQNKINESEYADGWTQRLMELNLSIDEARYQLNNLQERLIVSNVVSSPTDGTVIGLQVSIGEVVKGGIPGVSIASLGTGMDAIIFVPAQEGKLVKPGMTAFVSPSTVKREEFGSIVGEVKTVSQFPTTKEAMMAVLQNSNLVDFLTNKGPPITVRVRLTEDPDTYSGYAWSSSSGPEQQVTPGSLANARITVREQPPVSLVIPGLTKLIEG
jgi:HlyD family secretion protein